VFSQSNALVKTFEHELAHARHVWLVKLHPEFNVRWQKTAGTYNKVIHTSKGYRYKNGNHKKMALGYVRPYGGKNFYEDIATFVEEINAGKIQNFSKIGDAFDIYLRKIKLLKDYHFITASKASDAKNMIALTAKRINYASRRR